MSSDTTEPTVTKLELSINDNGDVLASWNADGQTSDDWIGLYQGTNRITWFAVHKHTSPYQLTNSSLEEGMELQYFTTADKFVAKTGAVPATQASMTNS